MHTTGNYPGYTVPAALFHVLYCIMWDGFRFPVTMNIEASYHPALQALSDAIQELRTDPPQHNRGLKDRIERLLGQFPHFPGHFLYIYNFSEGRIAYAHGIQEILGYPNDAMDLDLLFQIIHPEDGPLVARINQCALEAMGKIRNPVNLHDLSLSVDYRIRKADGRYIKVLDQTSVFEVENTSGKVHSIFSLCKDITGIKSSNKIGWQAHGFEFLDFEPPEGAETQLQYRPTGREMEVVRKMAQGKSSKAIAIELNISPMTVGTHRRNILQRTGMRNTPELIRHATAVGWV